MLLCRSRRSGVEIPFYTSYKSDFHALSKDQDVTTLHWNIGIKPSELECTRVYSRSLAEQAAVLVVP